MFSTSSGKFGFILSGRKPFTKTAIPNERPKILLVRFLLSPHEGGRAFPVVCEIPGRHSQARSKLLQTKQLELDYSGLVQHPIRKPTDPSSLPIRRVFLSTEPSYPQSLPIHRVFRSTESSDPQSLPIRKANLSIESSDP